MSDLPSSLSMAEIQQTQRLSFIEGGFTQIFLTWTSGSILTGYLLYLGAGPSVLAAMASLPMLVQVVLPIAVWLALSMGSRRRFMIVTASIGRGLWLGAIAIPLLPVSDAARPFLLLLLLFLSSLFQTMVGPAWVSLMSDVVPEVQRGRYFGLRNGWMGVIGTAAALAASWFLDRVPSPLGFQVVYAVGLVFAMIGIHLYRNHAEPALPKQTVSLMEIIRVPFRDPGFRRFLRFTLYWNASVMVAAPFVIPYFFQHLGMSFTQLAIWSGISALAMLFTAPLWGKVADRFGHKHVLAITTFLAGTVNPVCWLLAQPGNLTFVWISGLMDALSWGGINTALFNLSIGTAPSARRMSYLAMLGVATGLTGFVVATGSGILLGHLIAHDVWIGTFHWTGYHSLFLISGILRTFAWLGLRSVPEQRAWQINDIRRFFWQRYVMRLPWKGGSA
ncbi:MAG: MFS transporter [Kiritimatiellae bacterium]|nr:MFS transporter [Kiritimatiellia bacterium]